MIGTILEQDGGESAMVAMITLLVTPASGKLMREDTLNMLRKGERVGNWRECR